MCRCETEQSMDENITKQHFLIAAAQFLYHLSNKGVASKRHLNLLKPETHS